MLLRLIRLRVVVARRQAKRGNRCIKKEENERGNQAEKNRSKKSAEVSATTRMRWTYSQACYEREGGVQRVVAG